MGITEKLKNIQVNIKAPKNLYNSFGKYKYRNAEGICEAVKPFLDKEGCTLTLQDDIIEVGGRVYVKATATIRDCETGETEHVSAFAREALEKKGMDDSQITGTASSYARKYALNGLFLLDDTKDADSDEYANQTKAKAEKVDKEDEWEKLKKQKIDEVKVKALKARCAGDNVPEELILKLYKVKSLEEITEEKFRNINDFWERILEEARK